MLPLARGHRNERTNKQCSPLRFALRLTDKSDEQTDGGRRSPDSGETSWTAIVVVVIIVHVSCCVCVLLLLLPPNALRN